MINSPFHMLNRFSTLWVSILCINATSTARMGAFNEEDILNSFCSIARADAEAETRYRNQFAIESRNQWVDRGSRRRRDLKVEDWRCDRG